MTEKDKIKKMVMYIRQLKSGLLKVDNVNICDDIRIRRYTTEKGNSYIKVLIKLPKEDT